MSTPVGHSRLQALHETHSFSAAATSSPASASALPTAPSAPAAACWPGRASHRTLVPRHPIARAHRPRVETTGRSRCCCTSPPRTAARPHQPPRNYGHPDQSNTGTTAASAAYAGPYRNSVRSSIRRRPHDAPGVQQPRRDRTHPSPPRTPARFVGPNMRLMELGPNDPVSMFPAMAALVFPHERKALLGHGAHGPHIRRVLHVQHGPHMQAPHAEACAYQVPLVPCRANTSFSRSV